MRSSAVCATEAGVRVEVQVHRLCALLLLPALQRNVTTSTRTSTRTRRTPSPSSKDEEALGDPSELPFPHGDGASVVSSVAPSAAGSSSGSKSSTRLLCIECYAPRRMALLRAELYHTLDDLKELSAHLPDADADGAWKYLPSLAAITPDAVSSGSNVVSTAVDRSVGMGRQAPAATARSASQMKRSAGTTCVGAMRATKVPRERPEGGASNQA